MARWMHSGIIILAICTGSVWAAADNDGDQDAGHKDTQEHAWTLNFETKLPEGVRLNGAHVTSDRREVLAGKKSLIADFSEKDGSWHQFIEIDAFDFQKGKTYAVQFEYRIVNNPSDDVEFYSQLRSLAAKGDVQGHNWKWQAPTNWKGTINRLFEIPEDGNYTFMIGVLNKGGIIIDNITIKAATPNKVARKISVRTHPTRLPQIGRQLTGNRELNDILQDVLIVALNEGAGSKAHNKKNQIADDLVLDFVDWHVFGELAKEYGVRSSSGGCEYQEYYKREGAGTPKQKDDIWNNRYGVYGKSGFLVTLENTFVADSNWGEGGYFTCHNGVTWHREFMATLAQAANRYLAITQDNIACSTFNRVDGCYCPSCIKGFNTFIKKRFSDADLKAMGVKDLRTFSMQDYIVKHGLLGGTATKDALVRAYIKFQHISGLEAWADVVRRCKNIARQQGRALPCGGNQINAWGSWPYAVMLSQFCDFIEIEELEGLKEDMKRRPMQYKLGLASGNHAKPVWVRGPVVDDTKKETPMLSTSYWKAHFSEALANGGIRAFSLGINKSWTGKPETKDYMDDPDLYKLYVDYAKWMREHRSLLTRRESLARTAVIYSLPNLMFCQYNVIGAGDGGRLTAFYDAAKTLEKTQVPHDVVMIGHPEVWDDAESFKRLESNYDVVVLPRIDAMTEAQVAFFNKLAQQGVNVLADSDITFDENRNPLPEPIKLNAKELNDESLEKIGKQSRLVSVEAPDTVAVNLWQSCQGKSVDVHLLNYDVDVQGETITPATNIPVRIVLPDRFRLERCVLSQYGQEDQELKFTPNGDAIEVVVPELDVYAIISFTDKQSIERERNEAEGRRARDRDMVIQLAERFNLY